MSTLLALTVGGACAPVVTAIHDYAPEAVCFFASTGPRGSHIMVDGPGDPCGDTRKAKCPDCGKQFPLGDPKGPNILMQTGLKPEQFEIVDLSEPDSLPDCYSAMRSALARLSADHPGWQWVADYTGGTKTMSVALSLAALETGWQLSLVKGTRTDLIKVLNGSEMAALVNAWEVRAHQQMDEARRLFDAYAYASAGALLESLARTSPLSNQLQRTVNQWVSADRQYIADQRRSNRSDST